VLTKVTAYSQWNNVDPIIFNVINRPDDDKFEVRDIQGLGPVKASVNTTPLGSIDGELYTGSSVGKRNLVFTLGLTPDWQDWTVSKLRRLLDRTFMPKQFVRFVFETMEFSPVEISGYVESNDPNMFSKDPEQVISVICPNTNFSNVDPVVINGRTDMDPIEIDYEGNIECGINVEVTRISGSNPLNLAIETSADDLFAHQAFSIEAGSAVTSAAKKLQVNSIPGNKYAQSVSLTDGTITDNWLSELWVNSEWQKLRPGSNMFAVITDDSGVQAWKLTYTPLYGSL
jgi:hypothetical protein